MKRLKILTNPETLALSDEGPERSSTEDISSRPYSPSLSSSNEDILKPQAKIGDRGDCPSEQVHRQMKADSDWMLRSALAHNAGGNYPNQFGAGSKLNSIDLAYLKELDLSSTTESQAPSTLPPNNKEIESCTSFEYHDNNAPATATATSSIKSPFQREIQRLMESSSSKIPVPINRNGAGGGKVVTPTGSKGGVLHLQYARDEHTSVGDAQKMKNGNADKPSNYAKMPSGHGISMAPVNGKHPVGLEAIKEIAKNTTASESSHMQTSDTESCEMLQEHHAECSGIAQQQQQQQQLDEENTSDFDDDNEYRKFDKSELVNSKTINDILKYGAGHHSVDSNPGETQSEWSDEDDKDDDEAKGKLKHVHFTPNEYFKLIKIIFSGVRIIGGAESTGYITDEPGLENLSLLNEAGLTDAEAALSDVNSCNAHDVDDTSVSSRASSRLLSLDSLSGFNDYDQESTQTNKNHEKAIMNVSHKITNKFGGSQAL